MASRYPTCTCWMPRSRSKLSPPATFCVRSHESVLGNVFSSTVAPTGLAPQASISPPTIGFSCTPTVSFGANGPHRPSLSISAPRSTFPPRRPACSKRVLKRKRIVGCPEKQTRTRIIQLSYKQQITVIPLLPPPPHQSLLG